MIYLTKVVNNCRSYPGVSIHDMEMLAAEVESPDSVLQKQQNAQAKVNSLLNFKQYFSPGVHFFSILFCIS